MSYGKCKYNLDTANITPGYGNFNNVSHESSNLIKSLSSDLK